MLRRGMCRLIPAHIPVVKNHASVSVFAKYLGFRIILFWLHIRSTNQQRFENRRIAATPLLIIVFGWCGWYFQHGNIIECWLVVR